MNSPSLKVNAAGLPLQLSKVKHTYCCVSPETSFCSTYNFNLNNFLLTGAPATGPWYLVILPVSPDCLVTVPPSTIASISGTKVTCVKFISLPYWISSKRLVASNSFLTLRIVYCPSLTTAEYDPSEAVVNL